MSVSGSRGINSPESQARLDLLRKMLEEHYKGYDKKDDIDEKSDFTFMLQVMKGYVEKPADGQGHFQSNTNRTYDLENGKVKTADYKGQIGSADHIDNVIELIAVAKGALEKDEGFFNTPDARELPYAAYIAQKMGFRLLNAPATDIKFDPDPTKDAAIKKQIDEQYAKFIEGKNVPTSTFKPSQAPTPAPTALFDKSKMPELSALLVKEAAEIEKLYKTDPPTPGQAEAFERFRSQMDALGKTGGSDPALLTKVNNSIIDLKTGLASTLPAGKLADLVSDRVAAIHKNFEIPGNAGQTAALTALAQSLEKIKLSNDPTAFQATLDKFVEDYSKATGTDKLVDFKGYAQTESLKQNINDAMTLLNQEIEQYVADNKIEFKPGLVGGKTPLEHIHGLAQKGNQFVLDNSIAPTPKVAALSAAEISENIAHTISERLQTIHEKFVGSSKAVSDLQGFLQEAACTGDLTGLDQQLAAFEEAYAKSLVAGKSVKMDPQGPFEKLDDVMGNLRADIRELFIDNKLAPPDIDSRMRADFEHEMAISRFLEDRKISDVATMTPDQVRTLGLEHNQYLLDKKKITEEQFSKRAEEIKAMPDIQTAGGPPESWITDMDKGHQEYQKQLAQVRAADEQRPDDTKLTQDSQKPPTPGG